MMFTESLRNQNLNQSPGQFITSIAEHFINLSIGQHDLALMIDQHDPTGRCFDCKTELLLRLLSGSDVNRNAAHSDWLAITIEFDLASRGDPPGRAGSGQDTVFGLVVSAAMQRRTHGHARRLAIHRSKFGASDVVQPNSFRPSSVIQISSGPISQTHIPSRAA